MYIVLEKYKNGEVKCFNLKHNRITNFSPEAWAFNTNNIFKLIA